MSTALGELHVLQPSLSGISSLPAPWCPSLLHERRRPALSRHFRIYIKSTFVFIAAIIPRSRILMGCVLSRNLLGRLVSSLRHSGSF